MAESAARYCASASSAAVTFTRIKETLEPGVTLEIGTGILSPEEREAMEASRLRAQELQRRPVVPPPGGFLRSVHFSRRAYETPQEPQPTPEQLEARKAQQREREVVAALNEQKAAEEAVKQKAIQAIQQEQAEAARLAHEERFREQWGDRGGPAVLLRKNSPSYKGKR